MIGGCSAIQNSWFRKNIINRRVMGKQTCNANKCVTFTVIVERVDRLCQLLNLFGDEALHKVSIGHVTLSDMISYLADKSVSHVCLM